MPKPTRVAAAAAVAVLVLLAVVLLRGGDDDRGRKGEIVRGASHRGFPLRGSLAKDDDAIAGAVDRWRQVVAKRSESDDDRTFHGPDANDDVTVLWAGRVGERDTVMLEGGDLVAELTRQGQLGWGVAGTSLRDSDGTRDVPVAAGHSIVVPDDGARWQYVNADRFSSGDALIADGLVSTISSTPRGFVLPERADAASDGQTEIYLTGIGGRLLASPHAFADLRKALTGGNARAVWLAANAGQRYLTELAEDDRRRALRAPQPLRIVWTGKLPKRPHAAIVEQGRSSAQSVALGHGEAAGEQDANEDATEGENLLGFGTAGLSGSNRGGAVVAGSFISLDDVPYLVLAGIGVKTIHALVGDRELVRSGPAAIIPAAPLARTGTPPDTVIYGRAADGDVIAPLATK